MTFSVPVLSARRLGGTGAPVRCSSRTHSCQNAVGSTIAVIASSRTKRSNPVNESKRSSGRTTTAPPRKSAG